MFEEIHPKAAEYAMHKICKQFIPWDKSAKEIIKVAIKYFPQRVEKVEWVLLDQGYDNLYQANIKVLADHILGLDEVFCLRTKSGKLITVGLDVTINPQELIAKPKKLQRLKPMLQDLGIDLVIVVLWQISSSPSSWSTQEKEQITDKIKTQVKMMRATKQWVTDITLIL